jgi:hypothetical protein
LGLKGYAQTFTSLKFEFLGRTPLLKFHDSTEVTNSNFVLERTNNGSGNCEKIASIPSNMFYWKEEKSPLLSTVYNQNGALVIMGNSLTPKNDF